MEIKLINERYPNVPGRKFYAVETGNDCWQIYKANSNLNENDNQVLIRYDDEGIRVIVGKNGNGIKGVKRRLAELGDPVIEE